MQFHPARLRGVFELYFQQDAGKSRKQKERYGELSLEYALSQVFSAVPEEAGRAAAVQDRKGVFLPDRQEEGRGPGQCGVASFGAEADGVLSWALSS